MDYTISIILVIVAVVFFLLAWIVKRRR